MCYRELLSSALEPVTVTVTVTVTTLPPTTTYLSRYSGLSGLVLSMTPRNPSVQPLPLPYTLFFLWIEPISTLVGAYFAHFQQQKYLDDTIPSGLGVSTRESIVSSCYAESCHTCSAPWKIMLICWKVLSQLANLYFAFTLNEALVLRATRDRRVWSTLLLGLLIADFGHIYACKAAGVELYYSFWTWNAMWAGNLGFVYMGATLRTCFLLGVGLPRG